MVSGTNQPDVNIKRNPIFEAREGDFSVADFVKTDPQNKIAANPGVRVRVSKLFRSEYLRIFVSKVSFVHHEVRNRT